MVRENGLTPKGAPEFHPGTNGSANGVSDGLSSDGAGHLADRFSNGLGGRENGHSPNGSVQERSVITHWDAPAKRIKTAARARVAMSPIVQVFVKAATGAVNKNCI